MKCSRNSGVICTCIKNKIRHNVLNIALNLLLHVQVSWEKDVVNMIKIYLGSKTMGALSITSLFKLNLFF